MTTEIMIKGIVVVVAVVALVFLIRWLQAPRQRTERLAMTVWGALGPYQTAKYAEDALRWATHAVFGEEGLNQHREWFEGHAKNFHNWEADGSFHKMQNIMCKGLQLTAYGHDFEAACREFKLQALNQAQVLADSLSKNIPSLREPLESTLEHHRKKLN